MIKIIYSKEVIDFLTDLVEVLYYKEYFGFKDSAKKYVKELITEIDSSLASKHKRVAPDYFSKFGKICIMHHTEKTRIQLGTCSSITQKTFITSATSVTITILANICNPIIESRNLN